MASLNADPAVMEFLGPLMSRVQTEAQLRAFDDEWVRLNYGLLCVTRHDDDRCLGFIGLHVPTFEAPFLPAVEIGWRLATEAWGQGLATEGASAVRRWAHDELELDEIISITAATNLRSQRVMTKIGLHRDERDDFDHPRVDPASPLVHHVLFRGRRETPTSG
jgi:RimJ/RimL family protein N-acetyltransferase